jgi:nicotinate-nucleotide adenylyltransferase
MKIGLYFGSFNPIHVGHLIIANYMAQNSELDEIWLVVSPHNPLKQKSNLLADHHRLAMVNIAIEGNQLLKSSDIEFKLQQPNYTVKTLAYLKEKYPQNNFSLIMGEDNIRTFHKWYNYEEILDNHKVYVYPRVLTEQELKSPNSKGLETVVSHPNVIRCEDVPVMKISSSQIRSIVNKGQSPEYLITEPVFKYMDEMNFYKS